MKYLIIILCGVGLGLNLHAQDEEAMRKWQEYMTPSPTHKVITKYDGKWKTTGKMWMTAESEPTISSGMVNTKMILGGRYQVTEYESEYEGMPMQGISYLAYDNAKEEFVTTWIDNFGTGMMILFGTWEDENMNSIIFEGSMVDPTTGEDIYVKEIHKFIDNDKQIMEMYNDLGDGEFKTMEIVFERTR